MHFSFAVIFAALIFAFAVSAQEPSDSRGWLSLGIKAFQQGEFVGAIRPLQKALELDQSSGTARLLLSHRFLRLHYVPARKPIDYQVLQTAKEDVRKLLAREPKNPGALHALAFLALDEEAAEDARRTYESLVEFNAQDAAAFYGLGYVALLPWWPDYERALTTLGLSREDPGGHTAPFREPLRTELNERHRVRLERGIEHTRKALAINPQFGDAMGVMFSLLNARAYLHSNVDEFRREKAAAHQWLLKSNEARKRAFKP